MKRALPVYFGLCSGQSFAQSTVWTTALLFQQEIVGLTPFQLVFLGTVSEIVIFLCEIPTGVVADTVSRKLSILLGLFIIGAGFLIQGIWPSFSVLIVGMALWGLGETFLSGAREAWIADELPFERGQPEATTVFLRGSQFSLAGNLIGIWLSVWLATKDLRTPIIVGASLFLLITITALFLMPERGFHRAKEGERMTWAKLSEVFKQGWNIASKNGRVLGVLLAITVIGLSSEAFDRLHVNHLTEVIGMPNFLDWGFIYWFAILKSSALLGAVTLVGFLRKRSIASGGKKTLQVLSFLSAIMPLMVLGFALAGSFWFAAMTYVGTVVMRRAMDPLFTSLLNEEATPQSRATLLSFGGQAHGLGEVFGGPLLGGVAQVSGVRAALVGSAAVALGAFASVIRAWRKR